MARKKREEEHENHERWLVSYADFITLLFAFFVVMYSVSRVDNKRLQQATNSIRWALHYEGTGGVGQMPVFEGPASDSAGAIETGAAGRTSISPQALAESVRRRIENRIRPFVLQRPGPAAVTTLVDGDRVWLRLAAAQFFDPGEALLRPDVLPILDAIAEELVPLQRTIVVEGHTDDTPVVSGPYPDNWALSGARATTVVSYLERAHAVRPDLLVASGFGSSRPAASGTSAEARETNRRLEILVDLGVVSEGRPRRSGR